MTIHEDSSYSNSAKLNIRGRKWVFIKYLNTKLITKAYNILDSEIAHDTRGNSHQNEVRVWQR